MKTKHIMKIAGKREQDDFAKVVFGGAWGIRTKSGEYKRYSALDTGDLSIY